jgi:hypothetical protein
MNVKELGLLLLAIFAFMVATAQTKKPVKNNTVTITPVTKFKPPVVKTLLGRNEKEATVMAEEANQLVNLPLKIVDDKNVTYTISSYQFLYKKKSVVEDEETGKRSSVFTNTASRFKETPLPKVWKENISGGLQKGEELYFFDIIVNDKQGRKFFAPDVKIIVK